MIKNIIKLNCSPRHVPYKIFKIEDIPYTINGKKVELAVKNILEGKNVNNKDALSNPESLDFYKSIKSFKNKKSYYPYIFRENNKITNEKAWN